jgi:hypothetical protein
VHFHPANAPLLSVSKRVLKDPVSGFPRSTCGECACSATLGSTLILSFPLVFQIDSPIFEMEACGALVLFQSYPDCISRFSQHSPPRAGTQVPNEALKGRMLLMHISAIRIGNFLSYINICTPLRVHACVLARLSHRLYSLSACHTTIFATNPSPMLHEADMQHADDVQLLPVGYRHVITYIFTV